MFPLGSPLLLLLMLLLLLLLVSLKLVLQRLLLLPSLPANPGASFSPFLVAAAGGGVRAVAHDTVAVPGLI